MESKISVKTILLFTALFILGTMILGFYSCSGNTTPVSPQLEEEFTEEILDPADDVAIIDNEDGTITIIGSDGDEITIITPGTTIITEDGTTITTYTVVLDEDGNLVIVDPRESAATEGGLSDDLIYLTFSPFVQDGEFWTGDVTVVNDSSSLVHFPRVVFGDYAASIPDPQSVEFNLVDFLETLANPDIYFGLYRDGAGLVTAYPAIFIADEDENYTVEPGEVAVHEITVRFNPETAPEQYYEANLVYEMAAVPAGSEVFNVKLRNEIPIGIDIEFVEYVDEVSRIAVTVDADPNWTPEEIVVLVEDSLNGDALTFTFSEFNEFHQLIYTGEIRWNPDEDGPINVMVYFRDNPIIGVRADSFMDFTTLTP